MITSAELAAIPLLTDLTDDQLTFVPRSVEDIRLVPGEFAAREGDERALFLVVEGVMELTKDINGVERRVGKRRPGEMYGEVPVMLSTNLPASYGAIEASRILKLDSASFFTLAAMAPQVAAAVGASALQRIESLKEIAAETASPDMTVIGPSVDPRVHVIRTFLNRNRLSYEVLDTTDPAHAALVPDDGVVPVAVLADGTRLVDPSLREIAIAARVPVAPARTDYDVIIVGGGPTGLTAAVLTSGVEWRHVDIPEIDRFVGNGVYYGAARSDSGIVHGKDVFIIGAGNSAGQAAVFFSRVSRSVTLIVRGESLGASMSQYLIEQLRTNPSISIQTRAAVVALHGAERLEAIEVIDRRTQTVTRRDAEVLFVMIGADAETSWLPDQVARDANGFVLIGPHAAVSGAWTQERAPFALETTAPGIFAAGDVRSGSVKRVAAGVGEGGMAVAFVHQYLALASASG